MLINKKYAIYYRTIPAVLEQHIALDSFIKYVKDGLKTFSDGHKCPRMSVVIEPCGNDETDKSRVKKFEALLEELESNNQIVGFSG